MFDIRLLKRILVKYLLTSTWTVLIKVKRKRKRNQMENYLDNH